MARGRQDIARIQNFIRSASSHKQFHHPPSHHQNMNRTTTNGAPFNPPENREASSHYFIPARAKVRNAVGYFSNLQSYESARLGIS